MLELRNVTKTVAGVDHIRDVSLTLQHGSLNVLLGPTLSGKTQINLFFEPSTRTQASFEIAGKRLGAQVTNMSVRTSSITKGETLIDTAATLNERDNHALLGAA